MNTRGLMLVRAASTLFFGSGSLLLVVVETILVGPTGLRADQEGREQLGAVEGGGQTIKGRRVDRGDTVKPIKRRKEVGAQINTRAMITASVRKG